MICFLVVTSDLAGAMCDMKKRDKITKTGQDRASSPTGRNILFVKDVDAIAAAPGLKLSGYEFIRFNGTDPTLTEAIVSTELDKYKL